MLLLTGTLNYCRAQPILDTNALYQNILRKRLSSAYLDSAKAALNFQLSRSWQDADSIKARAYFLEGQRLSKTSAFMIAFSYYQEGYAHFFTNLAKSEAAYLKADQLFRKINTKEAWQMRSKTWNNLGLIAQAKDDEKSYVDIMLNKAIPLAIKAEDTDLVTALYLRLGDAFLKIKQYQIAEGYFNKGIKAIKATQPSKSRTLNLIMAYSNTGENYVLSQKYAQANAALDTMRKLISSDSSQYFASEYHLIKGMSYHALKNYDAAINEFDKGLKPTLYKKDSQNNQRLLFYKVKSLLASKKYEKTLQLSTYILNDDEILYSYNGQMELYNALAESYAGLGKMDLAYKWQKRYSQLSDSLSETRLIRDINGLELKYRNAERIKEIDGLKAQNEHAELAARNNRLIQWLLIATALFLFIVVLFYIQYNINNKKLIVQKELSHLQQLNEIEHQQELRYSKAMIQGEEQERRRMARDLHDGLGGMLAGVKINLSAQLENQNHSDIKQPLQRALGQIDHSVTELRRIAHNMMPVNLLNFGLKTALKDLCETLMTPSTRIDFQSFEIENDIPEQIQINIYRIVQEMLANSIRHANATNIILQCSQNGNVFFITQEDNGKGFDLNAPKTETGIGLSNIRNRVGFLKGKMEIKSTINQGTIINIELYVHS
uniref:sensor histidine kinase n=1 Tax=Pedobacter schmidteae TaxID=2201271 RepID=UPI0013CE43FA|nr:sensor histidine kinase [Pedobacter schmidteae]